ncbi:unnamed protein product [Protopolystoma xenopodis]|uniref:Uncharacterized protein n=1 Tax=Protopolystoma xenopodis TaxID=117903 RepID=A0A448XMS6_9PLAT|nr:unnamed protein product [Protopolystoma xenopodis]
MEWFIIFLLVSGSDDVRHMTSQSSAQSRRGRRTVSQGLLRTIQQKKGKGNLPSEFGGANLRIPSTFLIRNEWRANNNLPIDEAVERGISNS